jgi:hypothetical protein
MDFLCTGMQTLPPLLSWVLIVENAETEEWMGLRSVYLYYC